MYVNLSMLDYILDFVPVLSKKLDQNAAFSFSTAVFYDLSENEGIFEYDRLYLANSSDLPEQPIFRGYCSIITIGPVSDAYPNADCDLICYESMFSIQQLMNNVQHAFIKLAKWESSLRNVFDTENAFKEIGNLFYQMVGNPTACFNSLAQVMFSAYDPCKPGINNYLDSNPEIGEFMGTEEEDIMYMAPGFSETFSTHEPSLYPRGTYRYNQAYYNIFKDRQYIGRVVIEEIYKPVQAGDYAFLKWIGEFIRPLLLKDKTLAAGSSGQFNQMMDQLIRSHLSFQSHHRTLLNEMGWKQSDTYRCYYIKFVSPTPLQTILSDTIIYFNQYLDSKYIMKIDDAILLVINFSKNSLTSSDVRRKLQLLTKNSAIILGCSTTFSDFADLWLYTQQAIQAADLGLKEYPKKRLYHFDNYALDILLSNAQNAMNPQFYCTSALKKLVSYDRENSSEMLSTMKVYLANAMNASKSLNDLHICRSTFLYRLKRIKEISGIDLNDEDTRLYMQILFRIYDPDSYHPISSG